MLKLTDYTLISEHCVVRVKEPGGRVERLLGKKAVKFKF